jgi:hypothetical protein
MIKSKKAIVKFELDLKGVGLSINFIKLGLCF